MDISADDIDRLVVAMDEQGYGVLHGFVSQHDLDAAARFVVAESAKHDGQYFSYNGPECVAGTLMDELGKSPPFRGLLEAVYERAARRPAPSSEIYQALRVVAGETGLKKAWKFHYDSYVITALVPIVMPSGPENARGDLVIYPSLRSIRRYAVTNVIERVFFQNRIVQYLMASRVARRLWKAQVIPMEPGNLYFFRGYQSLHANKPCAVDALRCTALFHFADPHEDSLLYRYIRNRRQRRRNSTAGSQAGASADG